MFSLTVPVASAPVRSAGNRQRTVSRLAASPRSSLRSVRVAQAASSSFLGGGSSLRSSASGARVACRAQQRSAVVPRAASGETTVAPGGLVLVAGASGGVGQLVVANLLDRGYRVRAIVRSADKARQLFGSPDGLEVVSTDLRFEDVLKSSNALQDIDAVVACTGTTAFPSARWKGDNGPEQTDLVGTSNLIKAAKAQSPGLKRFILVSSVGVTRTGQFPYIILNAFGVLKFKSMSEDLLKSSGLPFTILRPGRLTDGPYTSYDLNTLLKATSGTRRAVQITTGDSLTPEATSRLVVAEACLQALGSGATAGRDFDLGSTEGEGPGSDAEQWAKLFASAKPKGAPATTAGASR